MEWSILKLPKTPNYFFVDHCYFFRKDEEVCMTENLPVIIDSLFKGCLWSII